MKTRSANLVLLASLLAIAVAIGPLVEVPVMVALLQISTGLR